MVARPPVPGKTITSETITDEAATMSQEKEGEIMISDAERAHWDGFGMKPKKPKQAKRQTQEEAIAHVRQSVERLIKQYPTIQQKLGDIHEQLKAIHLDDDKAIEQIMRNRTFQAQLKDTTDGISIWVSVCQLLTRGLVHCAICGVPLPELLWWERRASPYCSRACRNAARAERMAFLKVKRTGVRRLADTIELVADVTGG